MDHSEYVAQADRRSAINVLPEVAAKVAKQLAEHLREEQIGTEPH